MESRKKKRFWPAFLLGIFLAAAFISGCQKGESDKTEGAGYQVYYLNAAGNRLAESGFETQETEKEAVVQELLTALSNVPADLECQSAMPPRVEKITYRIEENVLYLYMDANYVLMDSVREILCRAALTKTLTQIEGIDYLSIYCAEQPIVDSAGNPVGLLTASDFVDSIRNINSFERMDMVLYFANETGDKLVSETREVMRSSNTSQERMIVEQLIEGPRNGSSYRTLPAGLKILNISVSDSVCSINFDAAFLNNTENVMEYIPIYSIVNSLTELSTVKQVQIRVNGSQEAVFRDKIPLNGTFERNYDYITDQGGENY